MSRIYHSVAELIGSTPLLDITPPGSSARILAKLEMQNPTGSIKDRVALAILEDAEAKGILSPGGTVVEASSGNTGIGLCSIAAAKGYRCVLFMPDSMSQERQQLMAAFGAEVVLTPGAKGMEGALQKARQFADNTENTFMAEQFSNPENPNVHYRTTGPEIYRDTDGEVDILVAGIGTGGTITGAGRYLKEQKPAVMILGVEPAESPFFSQNKVGSHGIQGIGAGFLPDTLNPKYVDHIKTVSTIDAMSTAKEMAQKSGILLGISSGAAIFAAKSLLEDPTCQGKTIVVICPDSGERYLSTGAFL